MKFSTLVPFESKRPMYIDLIFLKLMVVASYRVRKLLDLTFLDSRSN